MQAQGPDHYRFSEFADNNGVHIDIRVFKVVKETPRGYWVLSKWEFDNMAVLPHALERKRFVLKDSYRRYCYPDRADALQSFKVRKSRHMQHLRYSLALAEAAYNRAQSVTVEELEALQDYTRGIDCGKPELLNAYNFDC